MAGAESMTTTVAAGAEQLDDSQPNSVPSPVPNSPRSPERRRSSSSATGRIRSASLKLMDSNPPRGMWSATGEAAARAPSLAEIRKRSHDSKTGSLTNTSLGNKGEPSDSTKPDRSAAATQRASPTPAPTSPKQKRSSRPELDGLEEDDGFPDIIFGRGEMSDQSFVRGAKKVTKSNEPTMPTESLSDELLVDDDLDDLDPKPKRTSKNLQALFGEAPPHLGSSKKSDPLNETIRSSQNSQFMELREALGDASFESDALAGNKLGSPGKPVPNEEGVYPNGYSFPQKKSWGEATLIGTKAFLKFTWTPLGFLIVLYGLNVVAWGGMLFLLLCNASPAMCRTGENTIDCDNKATSPRQIWLEIDSQILNALFCVTGFGLIPWRFRDFYYLMKWRAKKEQAALRKLAGYHRGWFRLPGSDRLPTKPIDTEEDQANSNTALPLPLKKVPDPPLTGVWAPPTALWKMDFVVWAFVLNTVVQAALSGCMWGLNRFNRPSWVTGFLVALACIIAAMGGIMQFVEGKRIKKVEGIPLDTGGELEDTEKGEKEKETGDAGGGNVISDRWKA